MEGLKEILALSAIVCTVILLFSNNFYSFFNSTVGKKQSDTEKVELYYRLVENKEVSEGYDMIVLHGLFSNSNVFKPFAEGLMKQNSKVKRAVLIDMRNHGFSDHHDSMKFVEMANDVNRLIEKLGIEKYILVSHSMGAKTAMIMSMMKSQNHKIEKLVILDTFPLDYRNFPEIYKNTENFLNFISQVNLKEFHSISEVIEHISDFQSPIIKYFLMTMNQNLYQDKENNIHWKIFIDGVQKNLMNIIAFDTPDPTDTLYYTGPLLVLLGADSIAPDVDSFQSIYPNYNKEIDVKYIAGSKHWIHIDALETLITEVSEFIDIDKY